MDLPCGAREGPYAWGIVGQFSLSAKQAAVESVMAVPEAAVREIAKVLLKHVDQGTLRRVIDDLFEFGAAGTSAIQSRHLRTS